ncbi:MAG TPA: helix-turn-helix transcriptional regulator [Acidimicrobiales bacterium]
MATAPVGQLLAHWRGVRRMSQLALASEAQVSPRHVSFVESGRSRPSAAMVLTLARALDVPLRERNQMLLAAGHAPVYPEADLDAPAMAPVRAAVDRILDHHSPFPAVVKDRHWNTVIANEPARALLGWLLGGPPPRPANFVRLIFDPDGLRPHVANWDVVAEMLIQRVHREAVAGTADLETLDLLDEALARPGVPEAWRSPDFVLAPTPMLPIVFAKDGLRLSYFTMVTSLGTPLDITAQELRIESFYPADEATERHRWPPSPATPPPA